jgi:hypothetical protein
MSLTVKGGKSPRQVAARKGREHNRHQQEQRQIKRDFDRLQNPTTRPKGPVKRS